MEILFLTSLGLLAYTYIGYFLFLKVISPVVRRLRRPYRADESHLPTVSIVISIHNEEKHIGERIDNFEALAYPPEKVQLLLGDDCSGDRTREIIRQRMTRNPRIKLFEFDQHVGKTEVINRLVPQAAGEIIAMTDANALWAPESLRMMTRHFADPRVGAVSGRLVLRDGTNFNIETMFWAYETMIKVREDDLGVMLGANGAIYILRKKLFHPLRSDVIQIDDFIWPMRAYAHGYRGVYEPNAVAEEVAPPNVEAEFKRKVRIGTGDYRALVICWRLLLPWKGWIAFAFWSHKVLRWAAPFLLAVMFISNAFLLDQSLYRILFIGQLAFYASAVVGKIMSRQRHLLANLLRIPYYFVGSNLALLVGFCKCVTGRQEPTWSQKAHRA